MLKTRNTRCRRRLLLAGLAGRLACELQTILGTRRVRIVRAETFLEAWNKLHESAFDAVVVGDTAESGGWRDLVAEIAAMGLQLPSVLVSARADERLWIEALSAGVYDVLELPLHPGETGRVLRMAMDRAAGAGKRPGSVTDVLQIGGTYNLHLAVTAAQHASGTLARNPNSGVAYECRNSQRNVSPC